MAGPRTAIAITAAAATFAVGAVVAASLSNGSSDVEGDADPVGHARLPEVGDYGNDWHRQTALASYQMRLLRYAEQDSRFTGSRFAFKSRSFILYGAGPPPTVVKTMLRAAPPDAHVMWVRVPYSRRELDRAVGQLRRVMPTHSVVRYAPNFGGVLVGLRPLPVSSARQAELYAQAQRATDLPVTFLEAGFDPM